MKRYLFRILYLVPILVATIMFTKTDVMAVTSGNNSMQTATSINVNSTYTDNLSLEDTHYYKFSINSAGKVSIDFSHSNLTYDYKYWEIWIYSINNDELIYMASQGTETNETSCEVGLNAGIYYIKISDYDHSDINYTFKINYKLSSYWESECNNSVMEADAINCNKRYYGAIQCGKESDDWYKFTINKAGKISINFKHSNITYDYKYWEIWLYSVNNDELIYMESRGTNINKTSCNVGLTAGTYYIKISDYDHSDVTYNFQINYTEMADWESECNDSVMEADAINCNKRYYGAIQCGKESDDWYKFTINKSGKVSINFAHANLTNDYKYWEIWLYTVNNDELIYMESKGTNINKTSCNVGLTAGTYYIKISDYDHSDITYNFQINYKSSNVWEKELNNDINSANTIKLNTNYYGAIQCGQENDDWYKLSLSSKKKVRLNFKHKNLVENYKYWEIRIYDISSNELLYFESYGNDTNKSSGTITLKKGTYYIKVSAYDYNDSDYSFMITDRPAKVSRVKLTATRKSIKISWKKISGTKYVVAYSTNKAKLKKIKDYSTSKVKGVKTVSCSKNSKTIKKLRKGKRYYVKVCAYRKVKGKKYCGKWSKIYSIKVK